MDSQNKVVTTPAFMCETAVHQVFDGVGKMVEAVLKLCKLSAGDTAKSYNVDLMLTLRHRQENTEKSL